MRSPFARADRRHDPGFRGRFRGQVTGRIPVSGTGEGQIRGSFWASGERFRAPRSVTSDGVKSLKC